MKKYKFKVINEEVMAGIGVILDSLDILVKEKFITSYVIGGATALMYYSDPVATDDIDFFVTVNSTEKIIDPTPIFDRMKEMGFTVEREHLKYKNIMVQILMTGDPLTIEACNNPNVVSMEGHKVPIFGFEYVIALMVSNFQPKYAPRMFSVLHENKYDNTKLMEILKRYKLVDKFESLAGRLMLQ
jgi:hypothetical protein